MFKKLYNVGIIAGRFQHIHKIHEFMIQNGLTLCDKLVLFVSEIDDSNRTLRNPFTHEERKYLIKKVFPEETYDERIIIAPLGRQNGSLDNWMNFVTKECYRLINKKPSLIIEGSDKRGMDFFHKEDMKEVSELVISENILKENELLNIRGTLVRDYLKNKEEVLWKNCVNEKLFNEYERLCWVMKSIKE